jgi:hypothetical protein
MFVNYSNIKCDFRDIQISNLVSVKSIETNPSKITREIAREGPNYQEVKATNSSYWYKFRKYLVQRRQNEGYGPHPSADGNANDRNEFQLATTGSAPMVAALQQITPIYNRDMAKYQRNQANPRHGANAIDDILALKNKYEVLLDEIIENESEDKDEKVLANQKSKARSLVWNKLRANQINFDNDNINNHGPIAPQPRNASVNAATQVDSTEMTTDTDDLELSNAFFFNIKNDKTIFEINDFDHKKLKDIMRNKLAKHSASLKLTYFLKCKYAFSPRSANIIISMRTDARVWMTMNDYKMETPEEYDMLTTAVLAAYFIDQNEYLLFQVMSDPKFYNATYDFNQSMAGITPMYNHSMLNTLFTNNRSLRGHKQSLLFGDKVTVDYNATLKNNTI